MEDNVSKEFIEDALKQAGVDLNKQRLEAEINHVKTLVTSQEITVAQALETVTDQEMLKKIRPLMYYAMLNAITTGSQIYHNVITPEQAEDLQTFIVESCLKSMQSEDLMVTEGLKYTIEELDRAASKYKGSDFFLAARVVLGGTFSFLAKARAFSAAQQEMCEKISLLLDPDKNGREDKPWWKLWQERKDEPP